MGWRGIAIGGYLGSLFGGPLGAVLGAALGHSIEKRVSAGSRRRPSFRRSYSQEQRSVIFCASAAAMLAKMAKADGRVSQAEIDCVEQAFRRLGFTPDARAYAIGVFRRAKDDSHTIGEYAREFAAAVDSTEVRELFYEILWDIAGADGAFSPVELRILQRMPSMLGIRLDWYAYFASQRLGRGGRGAAAGRDPLADAYSVLGAKASDDAATLRRRYRELAKRNHPDSLRAQGLPEEMVGKATERMSRINAAWATVREARGI